MADKNIDPRFDPVFQRGYAAGQGGERSDAAAAARNVDAYRDGSVGFTPPAGRASSASPAAPLDQRADDRIGVPPVNSRVSAPEPRHPEPGYGQSGMRELGDLSPQSHYVGEAGTPQESDSRAPVKSIARNPWIYVLWAVGAGFTAAGITGQLWAYSKLYTQSGVDVLDYGLITSIQGLAPIVATVGGLSLVGAMVVHALNWMRQNP